MLATIELYDPANSMWTATGAMSGPRVESAFVVLPDGRVIVGGMRIARFDVTATLPPDGNVLFAGGLLDSGVSSSAELFEPAP